MKERQIDHQVLPLSQKTSNLPQTTFWKLSDAAARVNQLVTQNYAVVWIKDLLAPCSKLNTTVT